MHGANYGAPPPWEDIQCDTLVYIVDFSYPSDVLQRIADQSQYVFLLDHHQSAEKDLADFQHPKVTVLFDIKRSGARLMSDFLLMRPSTLTKYVEDRDLWKFKLDFSHEINAFIMSHSFSFMTWHRLEEMLEKPDGFISALDQGGAILRKQSNDVQSLISAAGSMMFTIGGHRVPCISAPITLCSEIGNILAKGKPFAATYYDDEEYRRYSLRSAPDGMDVSEIAKLYGGGGHKHAAGFRVKHAEGHDIIIP